jgi:hypothetical protein
MLIIAGSEIVKSDDRVIGLMTVRFVPSGIWNSRRIENADLQGNFTEQGKSLDLSEENHQGRNRSGGAVCESLNNNKDKEKDNPMPIGGTITNGRMNGVMIPARSCCCLFRPWSSISIASYCSAY